MKTQNHLQEMIKADSELYERILDTNGFAYHFNQLVLLAQKGEDSEALDVNARRIAADLLDLAADSFSNHGCNDFTLENTEANRGLVRAMLKECGFKDEDAEPHISGDKIYTGDDQMMRHFARILRG